MNTVRKNVRVDFRILCEISSSHGGEYDVQSCLLGYTAIILHGSITQKTALNFRILS
jgi:hypothetical protein